MHDWTAVINQMPKKNGAYSVNLSDWSGKIAFNSNHTKVMRIKSNTKHQNTKQNSNTREF